jgi:hypothetical protein
MTPIEGWGGLPHDPTDLWFDTLDEDSRTPIALLWYNIARTLSFLRPDLKELSP